MSELFVRDRAGTYSPATPAQIVKAALSASDRQLRRGPALSNPRVVREYLQLRYSMLEHEIFAVIFVDTRNRVIAVEEMFRGTIDGASVHPREVAKAALKHNAAAVILCHNHPSGVPEPSQADELITRRLKEALALLEVRVLDHLVIGIDFVESFAERGLL
jgi:DNA repair protein RadC